MVDVIPGEISYPTAPKFFPDHRIYNKEKYENDLSKEKISLASDTEKYNGKIYYKDPKNYYGPSKRYRNIPEIQPERFYVKFKIYNKIFRRLQLV